MKRTILWAYSAWFRIGGLVIAIMSAIVAAAIAIDIAKDGYILVDGRQDDSIGTNASAIGTPLIGVLVGLVLFLLVPKVRRNSK